MSIVDCRLSIELFGVLTRLVGTSSIVVALRPGATVADVLMDLAAAHPETNDVLAECAFAIGDRLVPRTRAVRAGERLALLPPVSGG
jgi:molybdopterin converting factor small subunit